MFDFGSFIAVAQAAEEAAVGVVENNGIVGTFGINWKLFLAQLLNFGIVLFVFWKWVVKPLGNKLQERQQRIESGLKNAEVMEAERERFEQAKLAELQKAREEADRIVKNANEAAEKIKNETMVQASKQAEKMIEQTKASLHAEKERMMREAKKEIVQLVMAATEKVVKAKVDPAKDRSLIEQSLKDASTMSNRTVKT